jgi:hypothetical protein
MRKSKPFSVAKVEQRRASIDRWRKSAKRLSLGSLKVRDLIAEGRR